MHRRHVLAGSLLVLTLSCSPSDPDDGQAARRAEPLPSAKASDPPKASAQAAAPPRAAEPEPPSRAELAERGRGVYMGNCTACHNMDPTQDGSLGPAIKGSSRALIEARVLYSTYPDGYTPKRDTRLMIALPYLKDDIDALAAFLAN
jgi:mono/diheme cytochrome c family protein